MAPLKSLLKDKHARLVLPAGLFLAVLFVYPVFWLLLRSFTDPTLGFDNYEKILGRSIYLRIIWNTVSIAGATTFFCLLLGFPLAHAMVHSSRPVKKFLVFVVLVPFWTSILVRTFAWMVLLQPNGLLNDTLRAIGMIDQPVELIFNRTGVLIGMVQILLPFMVFPLVTVMGRIDDSYMKAAANLGARPVRAFREVYLPQTMPGIMTGSMLVFIISLGYFITPALLGGRRDVMVAQLIHDRISEFGDWGLSAAFAIILLIGSTLIFATINRVFRVGPAA